MMTIGPAEAMSIPYNAKDCRLDHRSPGARTNAASVRSTSCRMISAIVRLSLTPPAVWPLRCFKKALINSRSF
jgi:hypothetical protein